MAKQRAKSLRFTETEESEIRSYVDLTGEPEAIVLERVSIKGLRQERLERGLLAYLETRDSTHGAEVAGVSRLAFLREATNRGIALGDLSPDELIRDLAAAATLFGNEHLAAAVKSALQAETAGST